MWHEACLCCGCKTPRRKSQFVVLILPSASLIIIAVAVRRLTHLTHNKVTQIMAAAVAVGCFPRPTAIYSAVAVAPVRVAAWNTKEFSGNLLVENLFFAFFLYFHLQFSVRALQIEVDIVCCPRRCPGSVLALSTALGRPISGQLVKSISFLEVLKTWPQLAE